jgi:hypothetical protein
VKKKSEGSVDNFNLILGENQLELEPQIWNKSLQKIGHFFATRMGRNGAVCEQFRLIKEK